MLIFANNVKRINEVKEALSSKFKMKDMGEVSSILGMSISINRKSKTIKIDQKKYLTDVLVRFGMDDCNPCSTSVDTNQKLSTEMCPSTDEEKKSMEKIPYMQAVGCLLFAAQITRPDICFAVNMLSRF